MAGRSSGVSVTDWLLGVVLILGGVLLVVAGVLRWLPSTYALAGIALASGVLSLGAAFAGRTRAGFWSELVTGALLVVFGLLVLRFPHLDAAMVGLLAAFVFLINGITRLGWAREFGSLRSTFVVVGMLSLVMGGLVLSDVITASLAGVAVLLGCELVASGVTAWRVAAGE